MLKQISSFCWFVIAVLLTVVLAGCAGGGSPMPTAPQYHIQMQIWASTDHVWRPATETAITVPTDFYVVASREIGTPSPQGGVDAQITVTEGTDGKGAIILPTGKNWVFQAPGMCTAIAHKDGKVIATYTFPVLDGWG
ncbi:MAG: hypothetical protein WC080_03565 [Patescibacteria group bacterium]|jgi:hypothetical protein